MVSSMMSSKASAPPASSAASSPPTSPNGPMVFAHYMLITRPPSGDYTTDLTAAKAAGIDAFALNYGGQNTNYDQQNGYLTEFYNAANSVGMKVFISVDTTSTPTLTPQQIANFTGAFAKHPAQLYIKGAPLLSSFEQEAPKGWTWDGDVLSKISPKPLFIGCTLSNDAGSLFNAGTSPGASGTFTWLQPKLSADEQSALDSATSAAKGTHLWMASVAPWFFKRFDANQNWAQAADQSILVDRFNHLLSLPVKPDFIELTTWNDWGESSYFGPADTANSCPTCHWSKMDHGGFLKIVKPFITAFKSGAKSVSIPANQEEVFLFYRVQPAMTNDNTGLPLPSDVSSEKDKVYAVALLNSPAQITVNSGGKTTTTTMQAGASVFGVPATWGVQTISASRNGQAIGSMKTGPEINGTVTKYNGNVLII